MKIRRNYNNKPTRSIITLVLVAIIIFWAVSSSKVAIDDNSIKVSGIHKLDLKYEDIQEVSLKDSLPEGLRKIGGIDLFGTMYIGNFTSDEYGKLKVFVYSSKGPFIYITTKSGDYKNIVINQRDKDKTEQIYNKIASKVKK